MIDNDNETWRDWPETDLSVNMEDYATYEYIIIWWRWYAVDDDANILRLQNSENEDLFRWLDL